MRIHHSTSSLTENDSSNGRATRLSTSAQPNWGTGPLSSSPGTRPSSTRDHVGLVVPKRAFQDRITGARSIARSTRLQSIGEEFVVIIEEGEVSTPGSMYAFVSCLRRPTAHGARYDADARILEPAPIRATVVDDDDLEVVRRLREHGRHCPMQEVSSVVRGHDDRCQRRFGPGMILAHARSLDRPERASLAARSHGPAYPGLLAWCGSTKCATHGPGAFWPRQRDRRRRP